MSIIYGYRVMELSILSCAFTARDVRPAPEGGFRWNSADTSMIYASDHCLTAAWEKAFHNVPWKSQDTRFGYCRVLFDKNWILPVEEFVGHALPKEWYVKLRGVKYRPDIQVIGDAWLLSTKSFILSVPTAFSRAHARNFLINPQHSLFPELLKRRDGFWRCDGEKLILQPA